jgi:hypothetical protein
MEAEDDVSGAASHLIVLDQLRDAATLGPLVPGATVVAAVALAEADEEELGRLADLRIVTFVLPGDAGPKMRDRMREARVRVEPIADSVRVVSWPEWLARSRFQPPLGLDTPAGLIAWILSLPDVEESLYTPSVSSGSSTSSTSSVSTGPGRNGKPSAGRICYGSLTDDDLGLIRAHDVEAKSIRWLWKYRLPQGMALMAGEGGVGKSQLMLLFAKTVSVGGAWADGSGNAPLGSVVILSAEDRADDTIKPRLMAMGADMDKIFFVKPRVVIRAEGQEPVISPMSFQDRDYWKALLDRVPDCRLFIVDPLPSYLGRGVNDNKNSEIRAVMEPFLAEVIEPREMCLLANTHTNKSSDARNAASRISGSIAYANLPRNVHVVIRDPEDPARRYFSQPKINNGPDDLPSLAFRIERRELVLEGGEVIETAVPIFEDDPVTIDINEMINRKAGRGEARGEARDDVRQGAEWLAARMEDGPVGSVQCAREGDAALGRAWPSAGLPDEERQKAIMIRVRWWREKVLKPKLDGGSRKLGMGGLWFFTVPDQGWPPSADAIETARLAEETEDPEETKETKETEETLRTLRETKGPDQDDSDIDWSTS